MSQRRFAVYGCIASGDPLTAEVVNAWHLAHARRLVEAHDGRITARYFDAGLPRSTRWRDRPQAARLLAAVETAVRGFDAVVIPRPERALTGADYSRVIQTMVSHHVELWIPQIDGPINLCSEHHTLLAQLAIGNVLLTRAFA